MRNRVPRLLLGVLLIACARDSSSSNRPTAAERASTSSAAGPPRAGDPIRGLALLANFGDSLPNNSGNGLRCTSCHLDQGTRASAMSWVGTMSRYPKYRSRPGEEESIARRVNECVARSLAGKMLREDSREMADMIAYIATLDTPQKPAAVDTVKLAGEVSRGLDGYERSCARCHGIEGEGVRGVAPAVWGAASYSIGAGMARQYTLATFLRHNMPYDSAGAMSAQRAADIAAYVLSQARQDHPGKERDWPRGDPPSDVAYATEAVRLAGKPVPRARPLLARRVSPDSLAP